MMTTTCDCALLGIPTMAATKVDIATNVTTVFLIATLLLQFPTRVATRTATFLLPILTGAAPARKINH
jgi:hypothetical protein